METKLLKFVINMSKCAIYGIIAMSTLFSAFALDGEAQKKSLEEISIHLEIENLKLYKAFRAIEDASEFQFAYKKSELPDIKVNAKANDHSIADLLRTISSQSGVSFKRIDQTIHVKREQVPDRLIEEIITKQAIEEDQVTVTGTITDGETGEGLPSVAVTVKGTTKGVVSDLDGSYRLQVSQGDVLVFSYIGFKSQEVVVQNQSVIDVSLEVDVSSLDEVVVVGYGAQSRRSLTSSISSISSKDIKEMPVVGVDQTIQGRAAGVVVVNNTGEPGGGITMRIRGTSSIGSGNDPLFVIDGLPIENTQTANRNVGEARINGLSQINPADIESIEILKDAAATAIYGARASNGVVLITTKRGSEGASEFSFNAYTGISRVTSKYDLLGASDYMTLVNEGFAQIALPPKFASSTISNPPIDTDWQDELFRDAKVNSVNLSARGGNKTTGYMVSGGYLSQEGTITDTRFQRYSLRANIDHKVNDFIKIGTNLYGSFINQNRVRNDGSPEPGDASNFSNIYGPPALSTALVAPPVYPIYDETGYFSIDTLTNYGNPVRQAKAIDIINQAVRFMPSFFANISLSKNVLLTTRFSADIRSENEEWWNPPSPNQTVGVDGTGQTSRRTFDQTLWTLDNYLSYDLDLGEGSTLSFLGGNSVQRSSRESSFVLGASIESPFIKTLNAAPEYDITTSDREAWSLASFFGRINYDFKNRYLINLNARYDGSSRFGENNRFGFFPSGAIGWRISSEPFAEGISAIFDDLKLRTSYGITGNQSIGNYASRALMNIGVGTNAGNNYTGRTGASFRSLASSGLSWEETAQLDIGLDATFFKNRINVTMDYYIKTTDKLLFNVPLPSQTGFTSIVDNVGKMENKGFEFAVSSVNVDRNGWYWTTNLNISTNKNKILELLDDEDVVVGSSFSGFSIARVGESIGFYSYEREKYVNPDDGTVILVDQVTVDSDNDGVPDEVDGVVNTDDLVITGNPFPDVFGGVNNYISYRSFDLSVFFQYSLGNDIFNLTRRSLELMRLPNNGFASGNTTQRAFDERWQNPGDVTEYPKINYDQTNNDFNQPHNGWIEDGSYLRLKTLTLGYNLGAKALERLKMKRARVYISTNNLLTFTNYTGMDPEVDHYQGVFSGGNAGLLKGYDYGDYPQAKSFVLGLNITF